MVLPAKGLERISQLKIKEEPIQKRLHGNQLLENKTCSTLVRR